MTTDCQSALKITTPAASFSLKFQFYFPMITNFYGTLENSIKAQMWITLSLFAVLLFGHPSLRKGRHFIHDLHSRLDQPHGQDRTGSLA